MVKKAAVILLALGVSGSARAHERDVLARFEGGIGVIPVANGAGPVTADGTFPNVKLKHRERSPARRRTVEDRRPQGRHRHERTDQRSGDAACCWRAATALARTPVRASSRR